MEDRSRWRGLRHVASLIILVALIAHSSALPTGAPAEACDNMTPNHKVPSHGGSGGYLIHHNISQNYTAGHTYNISISGTDNPTFKGFFCQVRKADGDSARDAVGQFIDNGWYPADGVRLSSCTPASIGVTHTNNQDKTFRSFRWKAPAAGTGPVQIWCSFVKVKLEFWVHVKSEVFEENGGTTTPPPHVTTSPHEKLNMTACGTSLGCYRSPDGCSNATDCDVIVTQQVVGEDTVIFELSAIADGWVALGLNSEAKMQGAQAMGCQRASATSNVVNVKNTANVGGSHVNEPVDSSNLQLGLTLLSSSYIDGVIQCRFQRKFSTTDPKEKELGPDKKHRYLVARNTMDSGTAPHDSPFLLKHNLDPLILEEYSVSDVMNVGVPNKTHPTTKPTPPPVPTPSPAPVVKIDMSECGKTLGCYRSPDGCLTAEDCDAVMTQEVDLAKQEVVFSLSAKVDGWIAVGLNSDPQMGGTQAMACQRASSTGSHINVKNTANMPNQYANHAVDDGNLQTGLLLLAASYQNGRISCQFRRSFKATHDSEKALGPTNKLHYIVAMNSKSSSTAPADRPLLYKHDSTPTILDQFSVTDKMNVGGGSMIDQSGCGVTKGCAVYPENCIGYDCDYLYTQEVHGQYVTIELLARSAGWVAVGYNTDTDMVGGDVIACQLSDDGNVYAKKTHNIKHDSILDDESDAGAFLYNITTVSDNGYIQCRVTRAIDIPQDQYAFNLNTPHYLLFAVSEDGTAPGNDSLLHRHTQTPTVSLSKHRVTETFFMMTNGSANGIVINLSECGQHKGCFSMPDDCTGTDDCTYIYTQQVITEGMIEIELHVKNSGWVAVGFNRDTRMDHADVVACQNSNGHITAKALYNAGRRPTRKGTNIAANLTNVMTSFVNGAISCKLRRPIKMLGEHDIDMSIPYYAIFASSSGQAGWNQSLLVKHTSTPIVSRKKMTANSKENFGGEASKAYLLKIHGTLMVVAWIALSCLGIVLPLNFKTGTFRDSSSWFKLHRGIMVSVWCLTILGVMFALLHSTNVQVQTHVILGIVTASLCFMQPFIALIRPHPGEANRTTWNFIHGTIGFAAQGCAYAATWFGLQRFQSFFCSNDVVRDVLLAGIGTNVIFWIISILGKLAKECSDFTDCPDDPMQRQPLVQETRAGKQASVSGHHRNIVVKGAEERRAGKLALFLIHAFLSVALAVCFIAMLVASPKAGINCES